MGKLGQRAGSTPAGYLAAWRLADATATKAKIAICVHEKFRFR